MMEEHVSMYRRHDDFYEKHMKKTISEAKQSQETWYGELSSLSYRNSTCSSYCTIPETNQQQ